MMSRSEVGVDEVEGDVPCRDVVRTAVREGMLELESSPTKQDFVEVLAELGFGDVDCKAVQEGWRHGSNRRRSIFRAVTSVGHVEVKVVYSEGGWFCEFSVEEVYVDIF